MRKRSSRHGGVPGLAALGVRCGCALGLVEIGSGLASGRFQVLDDPFRQVLFFLMPIGLYGLAGLVLGTLLGLATRHRPLPALLGAAVLLLWTAKEVLLWGAPQRLLEGTLGMKLAPGVLPRALTQATSGGGRALVALFALAALLTVVAPPLWRRAWRRRVLLTGLLAGLAAVVATGAWLATAPSPVRLDPPRAKAPADAPNVVLVTWDTVRADVLPLYGGRAVETPNLDALAGRSAVFERMTAVAPITGPSHASLLTGRMPPSHGLRSNGDMVLAAGVPTLAESFRAAGYETAAFVAAFPLLDQFGLARGFRVYDDRLQGKRVVQLQAISPRLSRHLARLGGGLAEGAGAQLPGEVILERTAAWLREEHGPFFLWVHFFDAHGPHTPPESLREGVAARAAAAGALAADPESCQDKYLLYLAEIEQLDAHLGRLVAMLEERDPGLRRTAFCLVADHGECFGEGGYRMTHAPSLYEATQWVPGLLHLPGQEATLRVPDLSSQIDVAPTLAAVAGVEAPAGAMGSDLLPLLRGGPPPRRGLFAEGFYMEAFLSRLKSIRDDGRKIGIRTDEWKYWERNGDPARHRLYRLADGEGHDLSEEEPEVRARLAALLHRQLEGMPVAEGTVRELGAAEAAAMAELGYGGDAGEEERP